MKPARRLDPLRTFFDCLCWILQVIADLVVSDDVGRPCTNGKTVYMPRQPLFDGDGGFLPVAGVLSHECGHVKYDDREFLQGFFERFSHWDTSLLGECFNTVLDVADETRVARLLPRAEVLFQGAAAASLSCALRANQIPSKPARLQNTWQLLAIALWLARSTPQSGIGRWFRPWRAFAEIYRAEQILLQARETDPPAQCAKRRTADQWRHLESLTLQLYRLVDGIFPPERRQAAGDTPPQYRGGLVIFPGQSPPGSMQQAPPADQKPTDTLPRLLARISRTNPNLSRAKRRLLSRLSLRSWPAGEPAIVPFDEVLFQKCLPIFRRSVSSWTLGEALRREPGHVYGYRLGQTYRAATDGRCFARRVPGKSLAMAVAVVVDCSGSMMSMLPQVLPVSAALGQALAEAPNVSLSVFAYGDQVRQVDLAALRRLPEMGSTNTHEALAQARRWLDAQQHRRKVILLLTDAEPDNPEATADEARQFHARGGKLLVGSLGIHLEACARTMPQSYFFDIEPAKAASSLQVAVRRLGG